MELLCLYSMGFLLIILCISYCCCNSLEYLTAAFGPCSFEATLSFSLQGSFSLSAACQIKLLNSIRRILSRVTLHCIRDKIDHFTGPYQSGFKCGCSCADIVWAQCMFTSVVMSKHLDFFKIAIDISQAFDTIKRSKILDVATLSWS